MTDLGLVSLFSSIHRENIYWPIDRLTVCYNTRIVRPRPSYAVWGDLPAQTLATPFVDSLVAGKQGE